MNQSIGYVALVVRDYDEAIAYYTTLLGFDLIEDSGSKDRHGQDPGFHVSAAGIGASLRSTPCCTPKYPPWPLRYVTLLEWLGEDLGCDRHRWRHCRAVTRD
jgi:catechol 2,3-dioxygenase-like lactoylglutathione lyase family enzyme